MSTLITGWSNIIEVTIIITTIVCSYEQCIRNKIEIGTFINSSPVILIHNSDCNNAVIVCLLQ